MPPDPPIQQLLQEWKQAEERARHAELSLYRAYLDFMAERGDPPPDALKRRAGELRERARAAYLLAMAAVDRVLDEADRRSRNG